MTVLPNILDGINYFLQSGAVSLEPRVLQAFKVNPASCFLVYLLSSQLGNLFGRTVAYRCGFYGNIWLETVFEKDAFFAPFIPPT